MSNEQTLRYCRKLGWLPAVVERRLPRGFTTVDLYGFADVVAVGDDRLGVLFIQCTSKGNIASRIKKITSDTRRKLNKQTGQIETVPNDIKANALRVLASGNRIEVWGWYQKGGKGSRWQVQRVEILAAGLSLIPYEEDKAE